LSIGGGAFDAETHASPPDFFRAVDRALYTAKHGGKNCVRLTR
jgi:GGDEF domain-containing protein